LQQQGFDYCYDKRLYDRLRSGDTSGVRAHLSAELDYQAKLVRFLENHDEPRAATVFSWPQHKAAAIVAYLTPGMRFFHQGQLEGAHAHIPTHLQRAPTEAPSADVTIFYEELLAVIATDAFRAGSWSLIASRPAWPDNPTWNDFITYAWQAADGGLHIVAVNYSDHRAQCHLPLSFAGLANARFRLVDITGKEKYDRDGNELMAAGLYLDLAPWQYNVFRLTPNEN
jgi:hypothetical protein